MNDLMKGTESMGLKACVELEKGVLTIKVWRIRTDVQKGDTRYGKAAWSMEFTDAELLQAWLSGYTQAVKDRDAVRVDG